MVRPTTVGALLLALVAILLPPESTAHALADGGTVAIPMVVKGLWIFKLLLLAHAVLLAWAPALGPNGPDARDSAGFDRRITAGDLGLVGVCLTIALALRLHALGNGLWYDEIQTLVSYIRLPLSRIITTFDSQNQHPVYSISARLAVSLFGESPWALRLPAALFGVASIGALYWFARQVTNRTEAILATALFTVSYHHLWFSQNARGYTALLLWVLLGSATFYRMMTGQSRRGWGPVILYAASMALATYTHITAVFVVIAHAAIWAGARWLAPGTSQIDASGDRAKLDWRPALSVLLAGTFSLQLYALVLPQFPATFLDRAAAGPVTQAWKSPAWLVAEAARGLSRGIPGGWLSIAVAVGCIAMGMLAYWRRSRIALATMLLPIVISGAAIFALNHNLWPRFFFFAAGFVVLIVMAGGFALCELALGARGRTLAVTGASIVIAASAYTVPAAWHPKQDYEGAARFIEQRRAAADAVVTVDLTDYPYAAYLGKQWTSVNNDDSLARVEQTHPRTWVLYTFPLRLAAVQPELWARLRSRYDTAAVFPGTVGDGAIMVMVTRPPLPPT
ncbi:MAG: glycosyltransferase family 39 protein [Gemmatimonadota bacterium]